MKKVAIALISIVTLSMMLMAIMPVMAKPGVITVVVKDANNKPIPNIRVRLIQYVSPTEGYLSQSYETDAHGKVLFAVPNTFTTTYYENRVLVGYELYPTLECGTFDLSSKLSARVVVTYPPSV